MCAINATLAAASYIVYIRVLRKYMKIYTNLNVSSEKTSTKKTLPMRFGTFEVNQLDTDNDGFEESEALEHQERGSGRKSRINRIAVSGCLK